MSSSSSLLWKQEGFHFLTDPAVQIYLGVLSLAVHACASYYYRQMDPQKKPGQSKKIHWSTARLFPKEKDDVKAGKQDEEKDDDKPAPLLLGRGIWRHAPTFFSGLLIAITWFYILRFILQHQSTSDSYFDDAYKDVLNTPNLYFTSTQLLTWAIVAVVWIAREEDLQHALPFLIMGFFGAMSASYVMWVPIWLYSSKTTTAVRKKQQQQPGYTSINKSSSPGSQTMPVTYLISSTVAFVAILHLKPCSNNKDDDKEEEWCTTDTGFGSFYESFHFWLHTLHICLLVPVLMECFLLSFSFVRVVPRVRVEILYFLMAVTFAWFHVHQLFVLRSAWWNMPETDCQRSITTDLVACTVLTVWVSVFQHPQPSSATGLVETFFSSWCWPVVLAVILSPGAVLAGHLLKQEWPTVVTDLQRAVASRRSSSGETQTQQTSWRNLGMWQQDRSGNSEGSNSTKMKQTDCSYQHACESLALALGEAASLRQQSSVLSCGCGSIAELLFFKRTFDLHHITGVDPSVDTAAPSSSPLEEQDFSEFNVRAIQGGVEDLRETECLAFGSFDTVLALDSIYHFPDKLSFFADASRFVKANEGGVVAVTDIVLNGNKNGRMPLWMGWILSCMGITARFVWNESAYRQNLTYLGYRNIRIKRISEQVFRGWSFIPAFLKKRLGYAIIVADAPGRSKFEPNKKKVAIIGSGMSGLSASHFLTSSAKSSDMEVHIYEAGSCVGLAGATISIANQLVDVPPRMASKNYYIHYLELTRRLQVPTQTVSTGCNFYGAGRNTGRAFYSFENNPLKNLYNAITVGGLKTLLQAFQACSTSSLQSAIDKSLTFGEWVTQNFQISFQREDETGNVSKQDYPSATCHDSPFAYMLAGSLTWMLSCSYEQLLNYPTDIVLRYFSITEWSGVGLFEQFKVARISPSIKALEQGLLYGVSKMFLDTKVSNIDDKKIIHGIEYDAVICATEASAVPNVIKNCSAAFSKLQYQPSSIYVHKDESFMPRNRKDWKCWNVEMSTGREVAELTFWLNEFYPDADFDGNIFETWAPRKMPQKDSIIHKSDFQRLIHTQDSKNNLEDIEKIQGQGGIFYAGSYTVYGMGLLEEALKSGDLAAAKTLQYLFPSDDDKEH